MSTDKLSPQTLPLKQALGKDVSENKEIFSAHVRQRQRTTGLKSPLD